MYIKGYRVMALAANSELINLTEVVDNNNNLIELADTVMGFTNGTDSNIDTDNIDPLVDATLSLLGAVIAATGVDMVELDNEVEDTSTIVEEQPKAIAPRTILVIGTDNEGNNSKLFEGESSLTKAELKAKYGDDIFVYYQQLYTTVVGDQTYDEAVADDNNFKKLCYTREEFADAFTNSFSDVKYAYITYSHKDLRKQQRANKAAASATKVKTNTVKNRVDNKVDTNPNFGLYLFTSMNQLPNGTFPIKGLSDLQISTAKEVLQGEDYYVNEYVLAEGDDESIKQQQEAILFIVGTPAVNDRYMDVSNLRWINNLESGEPVKGLIKNNINLATGVQVYMLRLNVWDKRQKDVFIDCNYKPGK